MELLLQRRPSAGGATIGELSVDGKWQCYICEDVVRAPGAPKVYGATAIPAGRYKVEITDSPKFGRPLPLLLEVPGFEGIRIHPGNTAADTDGCLLPGVTCTANAVQSSVAAFGALFDLIEGAEAAGKEVWIDIRDAA